MSQKSNEKEYVYKLYRVKRRDGGNTTVSVDPVIAIQAVRALRSDAKVTEFVRQKALEYERGKDGCNSCSRYVSRALMNLILDTGVKPVALNECLNDEVYA